MLYQINDGPRCPVPHITLTSPSNVVGEERFDVDVEANHSLGYIAREFVEVLFRWLLAHQAGGLVHVGVWTQKGAGLLVTSRSGLLLTMSWRLSTKWALLTGLMSSQVLIRELVSQAGIGIICMIGPGGELLRRSDLLLVLLGLIVCLLAILLLLSILGALKVLRPTATIVTTGGTLHLRSQVVLVATLVGRKDGLRKCRGGGGIDTPITGRISSIILEILTPVSLLMRKIKVQAVLVHDAGGERVDGNEGLE